MDRTVIGADYEPAALEALKAFGIEPASLEFANISENITFKVSDGRRGGVYALRLHRPGYHALEALRSESLWTRALSEAGVRTPKAVATLSGDDYVQVPIGATGERRWAGLAGWLEGEVLAKVVEGETDPLINAHHFERLGAIMAAMHNQASAWTPPAEFQRHRLDAEGLMGEAPFWGPFWEHAILSKAEAGLLLATRDRIRGALTRLGKSPEIYSVIHADLHAGNIIRNGEQFVVIDFDDTAFGWHMYDVAVALLGYQSHPDFARFREACLRGYRAVRGLSDEAVALLPMFLLTRELAQVGWLHQRPELGAPPALAANKDALCARAEQFEAPC
ncbi:MAG: phosphotransferase [Caulobacteraceae bacterium]|nr:phosphotransferase [Caulobacteraceae bacterium]